MCRFADLSRHAVRTVLLSFASHRHFAVAAIVPAMMGAAYIGPAYSITQSLVPLRMRARAVAILLFILNMIGLGLGPPLVGEISDLLRALFGADSLRWALMSIVITGLAGAFCYWRASRTLKADLTKYAARRPPINNFSVAREPICGDGVNLVVARNGTRGANCLSFGEFPADL